jgi:hypothetical protein
MPYGMMETLPKGPLILRKNLPEIISKPQKAMSHSTLELRAPKNGVCILSEQYLWKK